MSTLFTSYAVIKYSSISLVELSLKAPYLDPVPGNPVTKYGIKQWLIERQQKKTIYLSSWKINPNFRYRHKMSIKNNYHLLSDAINVICRVLPVSLKCAGAQVNTRVGFKCWYISRNQFPLFLSGNHYFKGEALRKSK